MFSSQTNKSYPKATDRAVAINRCRRITVGGQIKIYVDIDMCVRKCERERNSGGTGSSPVRIAEDRRQEAPEVGAQDEIGIFFVIQPFQRKIYSGVLQMLPKNRRSTKKKIKYKIS